MSRPEPLADDRAPAPAVTDSGPSGAPLPGSDLEPTAGIVPGEDAETPVDAGAQTSTPAGANAGEPAVPQTASTTAVAVAGEMVQTIVLAVILFLLIRNFIQNYRVENISMEPNLHEGQFLVINRFAYCPGFHLDISPLNVHVERTWCLWQPKRGDVIVFHYPPDPTKDYIKRVIGLPGDKIEVRNGRVYVNGDMMSEPFGPNPGVYNAPTALLGPDELYVMGDNRPASSDSRSWGSVPMKDVVGRAWLRYWPPEKWSIIPQWSFPELNGGKG